MPIFLSSFCGVMSNEATSTSLSIFCMTWLQGELWHSAFYHRNMKFNLLSIYLIDSNYISKKNFITLKIISLDGNAISQYLASEQTSSPQVSVAFAHITSSLPLIVTQLQIWIFHQQRHSAGNYPQRHLYCKLFTQTFSLII